MKRLFGLFLLASAALAVGADDKKDDAVKEELKKMEGTWLLVSGESNGEMMPADMVKTIKAVIKGDKLTIHFGDTMAFEGTLTVDPTKKPKTMETVSGKDNKKGLAIYELDGDSFKICIGNKGEGPTEFTGKKDSGCALYVYKREKK